jgi:hypothetical protein
MITPKLIQCIIIYCYIYITLKASQHEHSVYKFVDYYIVVYYTQSLMQKHFSNILK